METLFRRTVRHYPTARRSFLQLTADVDALAVGWKLVLILPLAQRHNSDCYYQSIIVLHYLSVPVDVGFELIRPVRSEKKRREEG